MEDILDSDELNSLVKQCLSIVSTATAKDDEIKMWINAAINDMERQGIDVVTNIEDGIVQGTIVMYVKGNFGFVEAKEKELAQKTYHQLCTNLSLSHNYLLEVE